MSGYLVQPDKAYNANEFFELKAKRKKLVMKIIAMN